MSSPAWVRRVQETYDEPASVHQSFGLVNVDVPASRWVDAGTVARDELGCAFFDWLSAVDDGHEGFQVVCHLARRSPGAVEHLLLRTVVSRQTPVVASLAGVFAGARWHERETHEMFGVDFTDQDVVLDLAPLLLPAEFEGHPLRKDFVLASRVAVPWPGAKEPGESDASPRALRGRRRTTPPGVPDPESWGPHPPTGSGEAVETPAGQDSPPASGEAPR